MCVYVTSAIKPLYSRILALEIGEFLLTRKFELLTIEKDVDGSWKYWVSEVRNQQPSKNEVSVAEEALGGFLKIRWSYGRGKFLDFIGSMLSTFVEWKDVVVDVDSVFGALRKLG
jgi:hypothetical protein